MNRQMSMFEEGGIADDGMNRDPVSGNEIPSGSLASEVRDDIPAQLSEGEYVVPADVVRYFGVKVFEDMRMEAKMGLRSMEQDGRIGGEPVEPNKGMTENDLASFEEMMRTGVANGGLMDKMVYTAMNDPLVNQKLNQGGMTVGFAAGGMAQSPYNDPTRIDQVIGQFMQMTKNNPAIMDELAKRGITINRTPATNQPGQMQAQNAPAQTTNPVMNQAPIKASEGTYLDPLSMSGLGTLGQPSGIAPLNMSAQSDEGKENYATTPTSLSGMFGIPGASYFYQGPGVPDRPADEIKPVCAPGTFLDVETNTCVPIPPSAAVQPEQTKRKDNNNQDGIGGTATGGGYKPDGWRVENAELDWSDPKAVKKHFDDMVEDPYADAIKTGPIGMAVDVASKYQVSVAVNELNATNFISELMGDKESVDLGMTYQNNYIKGLTERQQKHYSDPENQDYLGASIALVSLKEQFGNSFLPSLEKFGATGTGPNGVITKSDIRKAIENDPEAQLLLENSRPSKRPKPVIEEEPPVVVNPVQAAAIAAEQKRDSERTKVTPSQAASVSDVTIKNRSDSSGKTQKDAGYKSALKQRQEAKAKVSASLKNRASGGSGGFAKGGLMKKPNKK
jgi:hypothetical protein